jgi:hypothetical protein
MTLDLKEKAEKVKEATRDQTLGFITAALSLVAGLAWNDAISSAIKWIFPEAGSDVAAKFIYAILVTLFVVALTIVARRILTKKT